MTLTRCYPILILSAHSHVIILVTLFFYKVTGGIKPVLIKQFTVVLFHHLVGLTSVFLNEAEKKTVTRFVHSEVLGAVSHQCTMCQSCISGSPVFLLTSCLTVCFCSLQIVQNGWKKDFKKLHCDTFLDFEEKERSKNIASIAFNILFVSFNILVLRLVLFSFSFFLLFFFLIFYFCSPVI